MKEKKECFDFGNMRICKVCKCEEDRCICDNVEENSEGENS